jgi:hypothetical protein
MKLQDRSGYLWRDRPNAAARTASALSLSTCDEKDATGKHNGLDTHSVGLTRNIFFVGKRRLFASMVYSERSTQLCPFRKEGIGLIETNVAITTDTKQLKIGIAILCDHLIVAAQAAFSVKI